ncbi:MAG: hypothetical protein HY040_06120 [Planctomycetes bacterium]|nr:hypothetical protein [Planctomycetota bacterium]
MARQDDPTIAGDLALLRRIPFKGDHFHWDEDGRPIPSTQNFKDKYDELSFFIESETTIEAVMVGHHDDFGLVRLLAKDVRIICGPAIILCRDPPEPGHVVLCGKTTKKMQNALRGKAQWVISPQRVDPAV